MSGLGEDVELGQREDALASIFLTAETYDAAVQRARRELVGSVELTPSLTAYAIAVAELHAALTPAALRFIDENIQRNKHWSWEDVPKSNEDVLQALFAEAGLLSRFTAGPGTAALERKHG